MENKRKNILHIFVDQLRFDAIGAHNNPIVKTPNLDKLIEMGVSYQNAYTPSPVCVAARCSMITGKYPTKTRCYSNDDMPDNMPTFMEILSNHGYRTHGIGKCHFTPDSNALCGFQTRERQEELSPDTLDVEPYYQMLNKAGYDYAYEAHGVRGPMYYIPQPSRLPEKLHPTNWIGDRSVAFIQEYHKEPWYLFASFIHPHPPFSPPVPWHKIYNSEDMPLPVEAEDNESVQMFVNKIQNRYKYRDFGVDRNTLRCMKAYYYSCVSFVDYQVGRILKALEESGEMDNTMIVFASDHGELLGDFGCYGKRSMHDAASRIPFILYESGGFEGGKKEESPVSLVDLAPTFLEIAGIDAKQFGFDGVNLRKEVHKDVYSIFSCYQETELGGVKNIPKNICEEKELYKEYFGNYMVINESWKYAYSSPDGKEFLINKEIGDSINLAHERAFSEVKTYEKHKLIDFLMREKCDRIIKEKDWAVMPRCKMNEEQNSGLIKQNITCEWFQEGLNGYI